MLRRAVVPGLRARHGRALLAGGMRGLGRVRVGARGLGAPGTLGADSPRRGGASGSSLLTTGRDASPVTVSEPSLITPSASEFGHTGEQCGTQPLGTRCPPLLPSLRAPDPKLVSPTGLRTSLTSPHHPATESKEKCVTRSGGFRDSSACTRLHRRPSGEPRKVKV